MTDPWGRGRYGAAFDANKMTATGYLLRRGVTPPDGMPSINRFYINTGQGTFDFDDPAMGLDMNIGSLCAHTVDYNSDGWPDLLVCGETGGLHLFRNDQGQELGRNVSSILGAPINAVDAVMVDVNHDSHPDLITLTGSVLAERLQLANGTFGKRSSRRRSSTRTSRSAISTATITGHLCCRRRSGRPERTGLPADRECDGSFHH